MTDKFTECKFSLVDWERGELKARSCPGNPRNPRKRETRFPVRCANPACGEVRWLTRSSALLAEAEQRVCRHCQQRAAGRQGYLATVKRYGPNFALNAVRRYQLAHPSSSEQIVCCWLECLGVRFQRQVEFSTLLAVDSDTDANDGRIRHFLIDFVVDTGQGLLALEVNGYHHQRYGAARDALLVSSYPGRVLFLDSAEIKAAGKQIASRLLDALEQ